MALRDLFRRSRTTDAESPIGLGDDEGDLEPAEGGPSVFKEELAQFRWSAQQEAVNIARRGVDPEHWDDGRMAFEYERAIAHQHEALRDRLSTYVGQRIRDEVQELYSLAGSVALARDQLRTVDHKLVQVLRDWRAKHDEVADDELERSRYYRLRSQRSQFIKYLIAALFVVGEFVISGHVFDAIPGLPRGLGYLLALGVTLALVVIPHYTALGLKEGLTQYHVFEQRARTRDGVAMDELLERQVHTEERDDRGFRIASAVVGIGLLVMIVPLSWLRATGDGGEVRWASFFFFLLLQYCLSGYFFLREWLDHGHPSHSLHLAVQERELIEARRDAAVEDLEAAVSEFHEEAEYLIFTIQQAPRWDSQIVEEYNATVRYFRHLVSLEHPEAEQFITWARVPYLGSQEDAEAEGGYPLDALSEEHGTLEEDGPLGREWWYRTVNDALRALPVEETEEGGRDSDVERPAMSWLVAKSPDEILAIYLTRYFDLEPAYVRPVEIDRYSAGEDLDSDPDAADEGPSPTPLRVAGKGSGGTAATAKTS